LSCFFLRAPAPTDISTLSLHDALPICHLVDVRPVCRPQHELVRPLVVEVDEAGVRTERVSHLFRDEMEHLLEVQRRVDGGGGLRSEEHTSELQSRFDLVCRLLLEKKKE